MTDLIGKEAYPLSWPSGLPRTRIQDRKPQKQWKKPLNYYREALITELERFGVQDNIVISTNIQLNVRGMLSGVEPRDPGVAVYFSRIKKPDFSWQDILGVTNPDPKIEEITRAYRELASKYHSDHGGDAELFLQATKARDSAIAWINRKENAAHDHVIPCDQFNEVRLNLAAIKFTVDAFRQLERCGATMLLDRVFSGFAVLPQTAASSEAANAKTA